MGLRLQRFPEYGVELHMRSGAFTSADLLRYFRSLGAADALRWIYYYDESADTSGITLGQIPELKRIIAAKQRELFGDRPPPSVVVYGSRENKAFFDFWASFAATGEEHSATPLLFPTIEAACEALRLPADACRALEDAVVAGSSDERPLAAKQAGPAQMSL